MEQPYCTASSEGMWDPFPTVPAREEVSSGTRNTGNGGTAMIGQEKTCPNCEAVMVLRVEVDEPDGPCYECPICNYRTCAEMRVPDERPRAARHH